MEWRAVIEPKLTKKQVVGIVNLASWRDTELLRIQAEIDKLEASKMKLKDKYSGINIATYYGTNNSTVSKICLGQNRFNDAKEALFRNNLTR